MEADRFRFNPLSHSAAMPPTSANGTFRRMRLACLTEWNVANSNAKIIAIETGRYEHQPAIGAGLILELSAPLNLVAGRKLERAIHLLLRDPDEAAQVSSTHIGLNGDAALCVLAGDHFRTANRADPSHLIQPDEFASRSAELSIPRARPDRF